MNKKIRLILIIILTITVGYLISTNQKGTIRKDLRDFAIQDTSIVDKIFLANKNNQTILLERKKSHWLVNSSYIARPELVSLLLKTFLRMRVKEPVPLSAKENIIKNLSVKSTKVEVYQKGKLKKVFFVGGPTQNSQGTYMILEQSASPFIMEIPGFKGYLSTRFTTNLIDWRTSILFKYNINDIAKVDVVYDEDKENSFTINNINSKISICSYGNNIPIENVNEITLKRYLLNFNKISFSQFIDDVPQYLLDSIIQTSKFMTLTVEDKTGNSIRIEAYYKPGWDHVDEYGQKMERDIDYFIIKTDQNEFVYGQYYSFDPIFKTLNDFINS